MSGLAGRVALVTGAGSGIGAASAIALAAAGAGVAVTDLDESAADVTARTITQAGGIAWAAGLDVADEGVWRKVVGAVPAALGAPVTILYNNAALTSGAVMEKDLDAVHLDLDTWNTALSVTLTGAALGCKTVLPAMLQARTGSIINTSSARGLTGATSRMTYNTAKAAIAGLTRSVATQYGARGVRCNAIAPGVIDTPALRVGVPPERIPAIEQAHLLNRMGRPEEIAAVAVFLASDAASFITGQIIAVDGGMTAFSHGLAPAASRGIEGA